MRKAVWSLLLSLVLVASIFMPVAKAEPPAVPADPHIVDDAGDAFSGASSVLDILAVWFTEADDKFSIHFQTTGAPGNAVYGTEYRVHAVPEGEDECLLVRGHVASGAYAGSNTVRVFDVCNAGDTWGESEVGEGEIEFGELPDGSGYISMTFDKTLTPYTSDGATVTAPRAEARAVAGASSFTTRLADDTEPGRDHAVGGSGGTDAGPGKSDDTPKKKGCKKNATKGKKKGCSKGKGKTNAPGQKKKKKKKGCAPYAPGELGAEAETTVVTDAATEEAPIEVPIETHEGLGFTSPEPGGDSLATSHVYHNLQVDSASPTKGLFVRVEYAPAFDYDIFLRLADGTAVAYEADFNPATLGGPTPVGGNEGAHPEPGAGQIDGYEAADCDGFTFDVASAITPGGEVTMKLWLGEPGGGEGGARAAMERLQSTFGA